MTRTKTSPGRGLADNIGDTEAEPAPIGHNGAPAFDAHKAEIDDLYAEAKNWLDGIPVENQEQADALTRLLDMTKKAAKAADTSRAAEKKPHDDAGKAVQAKYKPVLDKAAKIETGAKATLQRWLVAEQERKRKEADEIARLARKADERAREQHQEAAQSGNLDRLEEAEAELANAAFLQREAARADKDKPLAKVEGMARGLGLRTVYDVALADTRDAEQELARYFWQTQKERVVEFYLDLARESVRKGGRTIPGCTVTPRQIV